MLVAFLSCRQGFGRLTFKGLVMTGTTTCNSDSAADAEFWVLLVIDIFKQVSKGVRG